MKFVNPMCTIIILYFFPAIFMCFVCGQLCETRGSSLGYGFSRMMTKSKLQSSSDSDENQVIEGTLAI